MTLKDQLDQAGYDTSTLDEGAVMKQLNDAGYDTSTFSASFGDKVLNAAKTAGSAVMDASTKVGNMVKGGAAGIADIDANLLPKAANLVQPFHHFETEPFLPAVQQAGQDVQNIEAGKHAETAAGRAGETVGSFFTPNQIALQAAGGAVAKPIAAGLGKLASPIVKGLVNTFPRISNMVGVAPEALTSLVDHPESVAGAQDAAGMASDAGKFLKGIGKKGMDFAKEATEALSDKTPVKGAVQAAQDGLQTLVSNGSDNPAMKTLLNDIVKSLGKDPSEASVQEAIEKLDEITKFNAQNPTESLKTIRDTRQALSNMLKGQNEAYKAGMEASSASREPLKTLSQNLGVKNGLPSDWTIKSLQKLNNPEALATQRALSALPGGQQLAGNAANTVAKDALRKSLLGKLALKAVPNAGSAVSGAVQALPGAGNAIYQGLAE